MTTGDWLGLVCLAGLIGFFSGGFFVYQLFFKREIDGEEDQDQDESEMEEQATTTEDDREGLD
jgi:hypothetical protein